MRKVSGGMTARDRILNTASGLFYTQGVRAVGVDKVIDEAKVAKATLYAHFRSKNELIEAYLRHQASQAREDLQRIERDTPPGTDRISAVFDHAAMAADRPGYRGCCFINAAAEGLDSESRASEIVAEHRELVLDYFVRNVDAPTLKERTEVARVVMALFDGAKVASVSEGSAAFETVRRATLALAGSPTAVR
ncbi:TetR/AcrR family transcriptional regulator [Saccharopolyspora sp. NPDC049426]|uniref:TetR/AcrR family transcriptional regulator n=1 Tax=Saccharopolyspora sp. NPDC049426 TaxID=3155652 RepID=UPI0034152281